jgi:hypothetical protein
VRFTRTTPLLLLCGGALLLLVCGHLASLHAGLRQLHQQVTAAGVAGASGDAPARQQASVPALAVNAGHVVHVVARPDCCRSLCMHKSTSHAPQAIDGGSFLLLMQPLSGDDDGSSSRDPPRNVTTNITRLLVRWRAHPTPADCACTSVWGVLLQRMRPSCLAALVAFVPGAAAAAPCAELPAR